MKILQINDPHFSIMALGSRSNDYMRDVLRKLLEAFVIAADMGADFVACTGDIFGRKNPVPREAYIIAGAFGKSKIPIVGILGNHDIAGYNLKSMESRLSGILVRSKVYRLLDETPIEMDGVVLTGTSYCTDYDVHRKAYLKDEKFKGKTTIALTHGMVRTDSDEFPWGAYTNATWFKENATALNDVILNGHYHMRQKPLKIGKKAVYCDGSISRTASDQTQMPGVRFLEVVSGAGIVADTWVPLKTARPAHEVFIEGDSKTEQSDAIREFAEAVGRETASMAVSGDRELVKEIVKKMGYGEEIENEVLKYMEV